MPVTVCPTCDARVRLPENAAGRHFRCPKCNGIIAASIGKKQPPLIADRDSAPHFADESGPADESLQEGPIPLTGKRLKTHDDYNPFDDSSSDSSDDDDSRRARAKRHWKPKDEYNPFAETSAQQTTNQEAGGDQFDFGMEAPPPPPPSGEFDFGPDRKDDEQNGPRRRRR